MTRLPTLSALSTCLACGARRVWPVVWEERGRSRWWLRVRCGECGTFREVVVDDAELGRFDVDLEDAAEEIGAALAEFERECMLAEGRCLRKALELDLIDASDFDLRHHDGR